MAGRGRIGRRWSIPGRMVPPAHSPVGPLAIVQAALAAAGPADPRLGLARLLARTYGAPRVELWASGTDALRRALELALARAHARRLGSSIAIPAFSCYSVATAAVGTGADLICYDVDPETLSPDGTSLEAAIRAGAGVIVVAELFGLPLDWEAVRSAVWRHDAVVVEDAAQAFGVDTGRRPNCDLRVLSFGRGKGWTGGGGGALLDHRFGESAYAGARIPSADSGAGVLLRSAVQWALGQPSVYGFPAQLPWLGLGETHYHPPARPRPIPRAAAGLALATHPAALRELERRRANARWLLARLDHATPSGHPVGLCDAPGAAFLRLPFLTTAAGVRLRRADEARALGALPSYPLPLGALPPVAVRQTKRLRTRGAELLAARLLTLPTHSLANGRDREALVGLLQFS